MRSHGSLVPRRAGALVASIAPGRRPLFFQRLPGQQCWRRYNQEEARTIIEAVVDEALAPSLRAEFYPKGDFHTVYFGQVIGVYRHS